MGLTEPWNSRAENVPHSGLEYSSSVVNKYNILHWIKKMKKSAIQNEWKIMMQCLRQHHITILNPPFHTMVLFSYLTSKGKYDPYQSASSATFGPTHHFRWPMNVCVDFMFLCTTPKLHFVFTFKTLRICKPFFVTNPYFKKINVMFYWPSISNLVMMSPLLSPLLYANNPDTMNWWG